MRKRKKVTFQLSNSAIVEPSSSYEELPTPDLPDRERTGQGDRNSNDEKVGKDIKQNSVDAEGTAMSEHLAGGVGGVQDGYTPAQLPLPDRRVDRADSTGGESGIFISSLQGAEDGGSGVGFFELDEELDSPGIREANMYSNVEDPEVEEDLKEPGGGKSDRKTSEDSGGELKYNSFTSGSVPIDIVNRGSSWLSSYGH
jgi:hypothetical protein